MQPKEIAQAIKEKLETAPNKKSVYDTLTHNLKPEFITDYIKHSKLSYDEWMELKIAINDIIDKNLSALKEEKLQELQRKQKAIDEEIKQLKKEI